MRNKLFWLILVAIFLATRLVYLNEVPEGVSLFEISAGNFLNTSKIFLIRLPFVLLSALSVLLIYLVSLKLFESKKFAVAASFILVLTPWHMHFSRIANLEIIYLNLFLVLFIIILNSKKKYLFSKIFLALAVLILVLSLININEKVKFEVDNERKSANFQIVSKIFSNKLTKNVQLRQKELFETIDIGYYFFKGQPKPRWGVEETQKLLIAQLPLILIGFWALKKKDKYLISSLAMLVVLTKQDFLLVVFTAILSVLGVKKLFKRHKHILLVLAFLFIFEFLIYSNLYFKGHEESLFSPRRPIFERLVLKIDKLSENKSVLITDRIINAEKYFNFYSRKQKSNYEFRSFDVFSEKQKYDLYVGVLPDDPSPSESLYEIVVKESKEFEIIDLIYDIKQRQDIVIFKHAN